MPAESGSPEGLVVASDRDNQDNLEVVDNLDEAGSLEEGDNHQVADIRAVAADNKTGPDVPAAPVVIAEAEAQEAATAGV